MNSADFFGLIVTPTRELAMQVDAQIRQKNNKISK
jgi:superfamily II DNA/RNA helicase